MGCTILGVRSNEGRTSLGPGLLILIKSARFWNLCRQGVRDFAYGSPIGGRTLWLVGEVGMGCVRLNVSASSAQASGRLGF